MFPDGTLTFREFAMGEPLPLSTVQAAVLEFIRGRDDAVLFGAQAVNAYVDDPRMTQEVDILSPRAAELAEELRAFLHERFGIAVRHDVKGGRGFRIYQARQPKNRHLADVRMVQSLPPHRRLQGVLVVVPEELVSEKVMSLAGRRKTAKGGTDVADLRRLLLAFPVLKAEKGAVADRLGAAGASPSVMALWSELVAEEIVPEDEDAGF